VMMNKRLALAVLIVGGLAVTGPAPSAQARLKIVEAVTAEPLPTPVPSDTQRSCCPKPCIKYVCRGPKLCCTCDPPVPTVLLVKNPCTGCDVEVSVCMPACCTGEPVVCNGTGLLGRNVVTYEWCCGYRVKVVFRLCGDVLVVTWGR
jgi:hypothetical protein